MILTVDASISNPLGSTNSIGAWTSRSCFRIDCCRSSRYWRKDNIVDRHSRRINSSAPCHDPSGHVGEGANDSGRARARGVRVEGVRAGSELEVYGCHSLVREYGMRGGNQDEECSRVSHLLALLLLISFSAVLVCLLDLPWIFCCRSAEGIEDEKAPSSGAKSLCIPHDQSRYPAIDVGKTCCPACGKESKRWTLFGRSCTLMFSRSPSFFVSLNRLNSFDDICLSQIKL